MKKGDKFDVHSPKGDTTTLTVSKVEAGLVHFKDLRTRRANENLILPEVYVRCLIDAGHWSEA